MELKINNKINNNKMKQFLFSPSKSSSNSSHEVFFMLKKNTRCSNDHQLITLPISFS
jgi:hypothetical protein